MLASMRVAQAQAQASVQARPQALIAFAIDAAPLANVLARFATRAGITLSYEPGLIDGKQSAGLHGTYAVPVALATLLQGSGIVALGQGNGAYVLKKSSTTDKAGVAPAASSGLPEVKVADAVWSAYLASESASSKLTAPLLDIPRSVTIIPPELLRDNNANSLADALRSVPGIAFKGADSLTSPAGDRPVIRGFDATSSLFVDGVKSVGAQSREIFAVEQVELVAGPGAVYSGWGAGGGAINLVTKVPKADNFFAANLGLGTAGYVRGSLDVNRQLNDETAARINLMWQDSSKAGRDLITYHRWGVAPSLTFGLNTPSQLSLSYYHLESHDMPDYSVPYANGGGAPANLPRAQFYGLLDRDFLNSISDIAQADYKLRLSPTMTLRNVTQWSRARQSFIATNPQWADSSSDTLVLQAKSGIFDTMTLANQTQLSGEWAGDAASKLTQRWSAGVEVSHTRATRDAYTVLDQNGNNLSSSTNCSVAYNCTVASAWNPASPWTGSVSVVPGLLDTITATDSASVYALDTIQFDGPWSFNAGLRYDRYQTRTTGASTLANQQGIWSYQLGAVYRPLTRLSLYASLSTTSNPVGADSGVGSDLISETNQDLAPERVRSLEAGLKWELVPQQLSFNVAVFNAVKRNARLIVGRNTINGGTQRVNGAELGLRGDISSAWKVFGGFVYLRSDLQDSTESAAFNGNQFPLTPRKSLALWTTYRLPQGYKLGLGATYSDKIYANAANSNFVPAYTKFDALVAYEINRQLELQLNLYNLTDKRYYDTAYPVYASVAAGRSAVLTARMKF